MKIMCGGKDKNLPLPTANRHQLVSPDFLLQRILVFCHTAGTCGKSGIYVTFFVEFDSITLIFGNISDQGKKVPRYFFLTYDNGI